MTPSRPIIDTITIPVDFEKFIPPDLQDAIDYYESYLRYGGKLPIQAYLCEIVRQFAHYESEHGRAAAWGGFEAVKDESLKQFFAHVGLTRACQMLKDGMEAHGRIHGPGSNEVPSPTRP